MEVNAREQINKREAEKTQTHGWMYYPEPKLLDNQA